MTPGTRAHQWGQRAGQAHRALVEHHWDRRAGLMRNRPRTPGFPWPGTSARWGRWHYWWQAQAMDGLLDAHERGDPEAGEAARALLSGVRTRHGSLTRNDAYDDLAWMGLACARAHDLGLVGPELALQLLAAVQQGADPRWGGVRWRVADDFHATCATAPAAILALRVAAWEGDLLLTTWAMGLADWLHEHVVRGGEVRDGVRPRDGVLVAEGPTWSYNVGTVAGVDLALAAVPGMTDRQRGYLLARAADTLVAGCTLLAGGVPEGPWRVEGSGDRALFRGILARYLAQYLLASAGLPGLPAGPADGLGAALLAQAEACWVHRDRRGLVGPGWGAPGVAPTDPRPDLASQLSAVMVMEAAARALRGPGNGKPHA